MGDAFIMRRGTNAKAAIAVSYPSGSTCTCTDGTRSFTAHGTSGSFLFLLPGEGDWTVSCTDGDRSASRTVTITAQHRAQSVTLVYELVLFEDGDVYEGLGELRFIGVAGKGISDGRIKLKGSNGTISVGVSENKIDVTDFSYLKVKCTKSEAWSDSNKAKFGLSAASSTDEIFAVYSEITEAISVETELTLDLTDTSGEYCLKLDGWAYTLTEFTKIWLV